MNLKDELHEASSRVMDKDVEFHIQYILSQLKDYVKRGKFHFTYSSMRSNSITARNAVVEHFKGIGLNVYVDKDYNVNFDWW